MSELVSEFRIGERIGERNDVQCIKIWLRFVKVCIGEVGTKLISNQFRAQSSILHTALFNQYLLLKL